MSRAAAAALGLDDEGIPDVESLHRTERRFQPGALERLRRIHPGLPNHLRGPLLVHADPKRLGVVRQGNRLGEVRELLAAFDDPQQLGVRARQDEPGLHLVGHGGERLQVAGVRGRREQDLANAVHHHHPVQLDVGGGDIVVLPPQLEGLADLFSRGRVAYARDDQADAHFTVGVEGFFRGSAAPRVRPSSAMVWGCQSMAASRR